MAQTLLLRIGEGPDQSEVEGLMNADKVGELRDGERVRFFCSSQCREVTSSSAI